MLGHIVPAVRALVIVAVAATSASAQSGVPNTYHAVSNRNIYAKPAAPVLGPAGWRFTDPTFASRIMRVTDGNTRPGFPGRSYSTPSAAHQLAWNATSDRFYIRSLDGWFIPYDFDPSTMTAARIQPTATGDGGLLIQSQVVEPQFSFLSRDIIFAAKRDPDAIDGINYPVVHKYNFATGQYSDILNLRPYTTVDPCPPQDQPWCWDTYAGALSSSATAPERISVMFNGRGQDWHYKVAVFDVASPEASLIILHTLESQIAIGGGAPQPTSSPLGFRLHHAWIDQTGQWVMLYPVNAQPSPMIVWNLATHTFTHVATRPFGHDALGYGWQVNQDCCTSGLPYDGAQWQLRSLSTPHSTSDLISPPLSPQQPCIADHTSWNNAVPGSRVPVLSSLYRYFALGCPPPPPWRAWDDELVAIQTDLAGSRVWRFAHHRSLVARDDGVLGTYFWYQPHANISPNGRWALFTSNWEKTLGLATNSETEGLYRTDVFVVRLLGGAFTDAPLSLGKVVRAVHFTELRGRIDVLRVVHGLTPFAWTDIDLGPGSIIKRAHLTELRTALQQAYGAAGQSPPTFTEAVASAVTVIRASHLEELQNAVIALEGG